MPLSNYAIWLLAAPDRNKKFTGGVAKSNLVIFYAPILPLP
jgi:hypothetical protein